MRKGWAIAGLLIGLAVGLGAKDAKDKEPAKDAGKAYEKDGVIYAVGETVHVVVRRDQAELAAMKEAIDKLATLLAERKKGKKKDLALGVENALTRQSDLKAFDLGPARLESVLQERWDGAPGGKEAWDVKVKISVSLR